MAKPLILRLKFRLIYRIHGNGVVLQHYAITASVKVLIRRKFQVMRGYLIWKTLRKTLENYYKESSKNKDRPQVASIVL